MPTTTTRRYYANFAPQQTLSLPMLSGDTTLTIGGSFSGWPATFPFFAVINYGKTDQEIVSVTNIAGAVATIARGQDGSTAQSHSAGATIDQCFIAKDMDEANAHSSASSSVHGVAGSVVGTTDAQTLTNKTIDTAGPNTVKVNGNTLAASAGTATVTLPNSTDTLVGRNTTDTLANKTFTAPTINNGTQNSPTIHTPTVDGATLDATSTIGGVSGTQVAGLPKGRLNSASRTTTITATTTDTMVTSLNDVSFTAVAGRKYKVTLSVPCAAAATTQAISTVSLVVRDGGASAPTTASTSIAAVAMGCGTNLSNVIQGGTHVFELAGLSAGTHRLGLSVQAGGSGSHSLLTSALLPVLLLIEDIGT